MGFPPGNRKRALGPWGKVSPEGSFADPGLCLPVRLAPPCPTGWSLTAESESPDRARAPPSSPRPPGPGVFPPPRTASPPAPVQWAAACRSHGAVRPSAGEECRQLTRSPAPRSTCCPPAVRDLTLSCGPGGAAVLPEPARPVACPGTLGAPCLVFGSAVAVSKILNKFSAAPPPHFILPWARQRG